MDDKYPRLQTLDELDPLPFPWLGCILAWAAFVLGAITMYVLMKFGAPWWVGLGAGGVVFYLPWSVK